MYKIGIIGLGYVGLPLAHAFSEKFKVVAYDINNFRISDLKSCLDRTGELSQKQLKEFFSNGGMVYSDPSFWPIAMFTLLQFLLLLIVKTNQI